MPKIKGWNFPVDVDKVTGKIKMVEDNDNIRQGIKIILKTQKGERKMRPYFGTDMNAFMFNSVNLSFVNQMAKEVSQSIRLWEKNLNKLSVNVNQDMEDSSKIKVDVEYVTNILPEVEVLSTNLNKNDMWTNT